MRNLKSDKQNIQYIHCLLFSIFQRSQFQRSPVEGSAIPV